MGFFSDAWGAISSLAGGSSDEQAPASISSATGELTDAGKAMGGQSAVDANMAAGADSESALGNFFHGIMGENVTGGEGASGSDIMKSITKNQEEEQKRKAQEERAQQEWMNQRESGGSFLPRIQSGESKQYNPMEYKVSPIQKSQGPFTGALNNINLPFQS